ncbi:MAG: glutathione synthetase [Gammaproteobacteria bacterium]|jgi:glutathione synthase|nr:glutathione synthetase [Gammaproteobacteria bacterium]
MELKLGVIMDPIETIKPYKDSTFALLLEAQSRNWPIFYMEQQDIILRDGRVYGYMQRMYVSDDNTNWYHFTDGYTQPLSTLDVILLRLDPPINMEYIYTTYLLEMVEATGTLVVNKPQSLRDMNEKLYTTWFPECCPATLVTKDISQLKDFLQEQGDIIIKPLDAMGGRGIFRLQLGDSNVNAILEMLTQYGEHTIMAQRYIAEISKGDKRIILINGEPIPYALLRIPAVGETRANLAAGGHAIGIELDERDYWICEQVGPLLRDKGIMLAGLDVIGEYLTEINVTSPTGIRQLDSQYNINIAAELLNCIEQQLE